MERCHKNEIVNEWIKKAKGDFNSALREYRARKFPNYDAGGFHAQQCIEKYLKALLQNVEKAYLHFLDVGRQSRVEILITPIFIKNSCI